MKRWYWVIFLGGLALPFALGTYLFGGFSSSTPPVLYGTYRPWLRVAFAYYGMAAAGLFAMQYLIDDDTPQARPTGKTTFLVFHLIALVVSLSLAYEKENCFLGPVWGCIKTQPVNNALVTDLAEDNTPDRRYRIDQGSRNVFMGKTCTVDCSGHEAGYAWAERNSIDDKDDCTGKSRSFIEGCESYVDENV